MKQIGIHVGINTTPPYIVMFSPRGGQNTGALTTRPEAIFGHRCTNATTILELYALSETQYGGQTRDLQTKASSLAVGGHGCGNHSQMDYFLEIYETDTNNTRI